MGYILITQDVDDGSFTVGKQYQVVQKNRMFVYAIDNKGNAECVYNYQFKWV